MAGQRKSLDGQVGVVEVVELTVRQRWKHDFGYAVLVVVERVCAGM